ncbi:hypothetical protein GCM10012275_28470 [Longimycelium tulufanense]|uniref:Uncharacterized protein n=1 Tax=Longimycelium tulufanense TaxID=907463 RepID=A0A8J3FUJ6_9PSEU|nr:hypothetical protein [Longimycelium tulufanense]GGM55640.1 hypothetical protein GCM10012275_28470 [Longimycelium tulufanense]
MAKKTQKHRPEPEAAKKPPVDIVHEALAKAEIDDRLRVVGMTGVIQVLTPQGSLLCIPATVGMSEWSAESMLRAYLMQLEDDNRLDFPVSVDEDLDSLDDDEEDDE